MYHGLSQKQGKSCVERLQDHAVLVYARLDYDVRISDQFVLRETAIIDMMLGPSELPSDPDDIGMLTHERLCHFQSTIGFIQLGRVASFHRESSHLVTDERVKQNSAPSVFENSDRQVGVLIVSTAPSVRDIVLDQNAGVDARVQHERSSDASFASSASERSILHSSQSDVSVSVDEIFGGRERRAVANIIPLAVAQTHEASDVVIQNPMTFRSALLCVIPHPIPGRYRTLS